MIKGYLTERRNMNREVSRHVVQYRYLYPERSEISGEEYTGVTLDLCETGATLVVDRFIIAGTRLFIKFIIDPDGEVSEYGERKVIVFTGCVVDVSPLREGLFRLGVFFGQRNKINEIKFFKIMCSSPRPLSRMGSNCFFNHLISRF